MAWAAGWLYVPAFLLVRRRRRRDVATLAVGLSQLMRVCACLFFWSADLFRQRGTFGKIVEALCRRAVVVFAPLAFGTRMVLAPAM